MLCPLKTANGKPTALQIVYFHKIQRSMEHTGIQYDGGLVSERFDGEGTFIFPNGTKYEGEFKNGMFHGRGSLIFKSGSYNAEWKDGKVVDGSFWFSDGLNYGLDEEEAKYADKKVCENPKQLWGYCSSKDRRFQSERVNGLNAAGSSQRTDAVPPPNLPVSCYHVGDGFYDPSTKQVHSYGDANGEGYGTVLYSPPPEKIAWIVTKCWLSDN
jgi:hypothetical protein